MTAPREEYEARLADRRRRIAEFDHSHLVIANTRIALALLGAVLLWQAYIRARISPWWPVLDGLVFAVVAVYHVFVVKRGEHAQRAAAVYERGLDRLAGRWAGTGRDGAAFGENHPYARDLDIFGRASLFELLNTARTEAGETTLAEWLRAGAGVAEVRARQGAVAELRPLLDFREDVAVLAADSPVGRTGALSAWAASPPAGFPAALRVVFPLFALLTIALMALGFAGVIETAWGTLWILISTAIGAIWRAKVHHVLHAIATPERDLGLLSDLLARIERESFSSPRLAAMRDAIVSGAAPASRRIARLRTIVNWADSTHNLMFGPIAFVLLVRHQAAVAIDRWHRTDGAAVADWLRIVGEMEALSALATHAYEHPADPFPVLADAGTLFDAEALGHPLLADEVAVRNDLRLGDGGPRAIVISGSNMSGKSTLLRSVGLNVVLALAGGPVRATALRLSPLVLGATLRVDDSLESGRSRFYAEILRIRGIVDTGRGAVPLLFLLDEILGGTNSHDRRIGAEAIVRSLVKLGAIGLVTTHDLALTELTTRLDGTINMHFEDRLEDGRMVFDYRIRPGVVEHSNALALMRAIGLDV